MPTHGHGQGYSDINFLIPELVERIDYKKGTYYADEGNFSAAGAVDLHLRTSPRPSLAVLGGGEDGYRRAMLAAISRSRRRRSADRGARLPAQRRPVGSRGRLPQDQRPAQVHARRHETRLRLTAMGYDGKWNSTDQIPLRAVQSGEIDRFGFIDPTDGGETHRYSLSARLLDAQLGAGQLKALAYVIDYKLDLISNFTYVARPGERRPVRAVRRSQHPRRQPALRDAARRSVGSNRARLGIDIRHDDISPVGLYHTSRARALSHDPPGRT